MPPVRTSRVPQGDDSIQAEVGNAKLFGKRCTTRINAGEYNAALQDAKTLVRLLPDAPIGYLKAARCYRLLKKLKAAQKMLDMAVERAEDESTIRAARTEQRKITEDIETLAEERSRPFADQLPEEIFLHVASYLSQRDLVRAAQVNQTWRTVLHSHPHLWTTMYLKLTLRDAKRRVYPPNTAIRQRESPVDHQIRFYEDRLPEHGLRSLVHLSLHVAAPPYEDILQDESPISQILLCRHRFMKDEQLQSLALSGDGLGRLPAFVQLLRDCGKGLRSFRLAGGVFQGLSIALIDALLRLQACDIMLDNRSAEDDIHWPYVPFTQTPLSPAALRQIGTEVPDINCSAQMERLVVQQRLYVGKSDVADIKTKKFESCQHLEVGGRSFSFFFDKSPMSHLRTVVLHNTLFNPSYELPANMDPFNATATEAFLQAPLDLPHLETFKIIYAESSGPGTWGNITRHKLRPSLYLCRLKAPKLRHLTIKNFGPITPTSASIQVRETNAWRTFCEAHPKLEELVLFKTTITDLSESLPQLPGIQKLLLSYVDLPSHFLKSATSPTLPNLKQLAVSHCSNITSGDLVRLVQSKGKQLDYLDIETCTDLQKEAVDWLKANVAEVKWSGWRDKNEKRPFKLRA